ncbi:uncharacterized protein LOC109537648 isoform X2 [Dendroctonus ponderosae]|uniref:uncharacterized protein LOC109537648 isoform X2 n=2 Tax=Dendroctonus ponderosae TaxID=77166 RepID=UPI00203521E6|nr:uncharacterized protein LOC109537648 isoform X2 [Dendroctonus ponderosae]
MLVWLVLLLFTALSSSSRAWHGSRTIANCSTPFSSAVVQLIVDYAAWRNIATLYIVDEAIRSDCNLKALRRHLDCFNRNGLRFALLRRFDSHVNHQVKRVLIVSFISRQMDAADYPKQVGGWRCHHALQQRPLLQLSRFNNDIYFKWLHIGHLVDAPGNAELLARLSNSAITLSLDLVVAVATASGGEKVGGLGACVRPQATPPIHPANPMPPKASGENVSLQSLSFCMLQIYKVRKTCNQSLVVRPLGQWTYQEGVANLRSYQSVDTRIDFQGTALNFGRKLAGKETATVSEEAAVEDDNDTDHLDSIADYICAYLNASKAVKSFPTLGLKGETGNWSGLLGAVVSQEVDIGLDSVIKSPELYSDMVFTQDIFISERHVYVKPEQSDGARDIFLATFQPNLLANVLATGLLLAAAMFVYTSLRASHCSLGGLSDALFWSLGIISMQGTQIQAKSAAGNMIIVISLVFALVIYNAYSAFITSKLSVKLTEIRTIADLLASDYDIGYATNSPDEVFLRSMNETQLNQIYLRGYLRKNINNITEGLLKATQGNYGFFASRRVARKAFLKISGYKCKFEIMEIQTPKTKNYVAFPMSPTSPYRKAIDRCLIKMRESGVHDYMKSSIEPQLPKCDQQSSFQSARLNDIVTAIALFYVGIGAGLLILMGECVCKKRREIWRRLGRGLQACHQNIEFAH